MSRWQHNICAACWEQKNPGRPPVRLLSTVSHDLEATCCFCGKTNHDGIYVRHDGHLLLCKGDCE